MGEELLVDDKAQAKANRARVAAEHYVGKPVNALMICGSCGREIVLGGDRDGNCYFCHECPLKKSKEETKMVMSSTVEAGQELPPVPPRPIISPDANLRERLHAAYVYYESNREAIIKEWTERGKPRHLVRWGIQQAILNRLLVRWGLKAKPGKKVAVTPDVEVATEPSDKKKHQYPARRKSVKPKTGGLPTFPGWDAIAGETELVKLRWLDTYRELAKKEAL